MRLFKYFLYRAFVLLFIVLSCIFMLIDNNSSANALKYAILFIAFGTFLAGSAFFNKVLSEEYHPLILLYVVVGLVYVFIGSRRLDNYLNPDTSAFISLNYAKWLIIIAQAIFLVTLINKSSVLILSILSGIIIVISFFAYKESITLFAILNLVSVVISIINTLINASNATDPNNELLSW